MKIASFNDKLGKQIFSSPKTSQEIELISANHHERPSKPARSTLKGLTIETISNRKHTPQPLYLIIGKMIKIALRIESIAKLNKILLVILKNFQNSGFIWNDLIITTFEKRFF